MCPRVNVLIRQLMCPQPNVWIRHRCRPHYSPIYHCPWLFSSLMNGRAYLALETVFHKSLWYICQRICVEIKKCGSDCRDVISVFLEGEFPITFFSHLYENNSILIYPGKFPNDLF